MPFKVINLPFQVTDLASQLVFPSYRLKVPYIGTVNYNLFQTQTFLQNYKIFIFGEMAGN